MLKDFENSLASLILAIALTSQVPIVGICPLEKRSKQNKGKVETLKWNEFSKPQD